MGAGVRPSQSVQPILSRAGQLIVTPKEPDVAFSDLALTALAVQTGGQAFFGHEDVDAELASSLAYGANYYTLTYYPSNHTFDGNFRKIVASVSKPGSAVRARDGYYALSAPTPATGKEIALQLDGALRSPLTFSGIPLREGGVSLSISAMLGQFDVVFDGKGLQWIPSSDGSVHCDLDIGSAAFSEHGQVLRSAYQSYSFSTRATAQGPQMGALRLSVKLPIEQPPHRVRIILHDRATNSMGSLDITDFRATPADVHRQ